MKQNKLIAEIKRKVSNMEDKKEKLSSTRIQCDKTIYRNFYKTIENTGLLTLRFLHI